MNKHIIQAACFAAIFFSAVNHTQAQNTEVKDQTKWYIGLTGGLSVLQGNFAKTDYADPKSGFAGSGADIGITGTYFITKHWGINALVSYHGYGFKGAQNLADGYKDDFAIDSSTVDINGKNYSINFMVGPYYSLPVSKKISLDFRVLGGLTSAHMAGNTVYVEDQEEATFAQKESSASAFGFQAGVGARYDITKHFGLMLNADYFSSKPDFSVENTNRANEAGRKITSYNQAIAGFNCNLTLVYCLKS